MKKFLLPFLLFLATFAGAQQTINCTLSSTKALAITSLVCTPAPVNGFTVTFPASVFDVAVTVLPSSATVVAGAQQQFSATVFNATNTSVTWIATGGTISSTGAYTAGGTPGTFSVTATSVQDPTKSNSATVTVVAAPPPPPTVTSIAVTPANQVIDVGLTGGYIATATYSDSSTKDVTGSAIWSSSNTSVATIGAAADPQPVLCTSVVGSTTVSAVFSGVTGSTTQSCINPLVSIAIAPLAPTVNVNTSASYIATGTFFDGTTKDITTQATWSSSVPLVVTMASTVTDPQLGTCAQVGSSVVKATIGSIVSNSVTQTCVNPLVSIVVTPSNPTVNLNASASYIATGTYFDGTTQNITASSAWSSSSTSTVSMSSPVTSPELGTCLALGTSTITATNGTIQGSTTQSCVNALVSIAVSPSSTSVTNGTSASYVAIGTYTDGSTQNITSTATWSSSATSIATVTTPATNPESVTCNITGSATITARIGAISGTASQTCIPPAPPPSLTSITVGPATPTVNVGVSASYLATGHYSDGSTQDVTLSSTWSAGTPSVVTVGSPVTKPETALCKIVGSSTVIATIGATSGNTTQNCVNPLVSIKVTPVTPTVNVGTSASYIATGTFTDGTTQNVTLSATWVAGTPTVVTVGSPVTNPETGLCKIVGSSLVTATIGAVSNSTTQNCVNPLVSIKVSPVNPSVNTGSAISYTATGTFFDNSTQNVTSSATWVAGTPTVVTMASPVVNPETGTCTALGGTSTVTATIGAISNATTQTCVIPPPTPVSLTVTPASPTVAVGSAVNYIATLKFSDNSTQNVTASSTWVSGTTSVVTMGSPVTNPEVGSCISSWIFCSYSYVCPGFLVRAHHSDLYICCH
jgi:hypothetical protein